MRAVRVDEFDYELPPELIAQFPVEQRAGSRLMCLDAASGRIDDRRFADLPDFLTSGDVMVLNDTRVIKARLFGRKDSGGRVEVLVQRILASHSALATIRASHAPKPGQTLRFADAVNATVESREADLYLLSFEDAVTDVLDRHGNVPLPPYIERASQAFDGDRYQTVYARVPGAVAAPTAGLHFDDAMLSRLRAAGVRIVHVTLHVGAGTFQPVRVEEVEAHVMHSEWYCVPDETAAAIASARGGGRRVLAIGTTSLRALESAAQSGELRAGNGDTRLFVTPGFRFRVVDSLLTNFHLPRSTLMMLVSAFGGTDNIRRAYRHAVDERYRFFSYGDAMLIRR